MDAKQKEEATYPNLLTCGTLLEHATYAKDISKYNEIKFDYESKKTVRQDHLQASQDLVDQTPALQSIKSGDWHIMSKDYTDTEQKIIAYQNDKQIVLTFGTCIFRTKKGTAGSGIKNTKDCKLATDYPTKKMELTFGRKTQPESKHDIYFKTAVKLAQFAIDNECNLTIVAAQETCILAKYASLAIAKSGIKADTRIMLFDNCGIMMEAHHQTIVINNRNNGITNNLYSNSFSVEGDKVFQHEDLNKSVTSILKKLNPKTGYFTDQFKIATDIPATIATNTDKKPSKVAKFGFWFVETTFAVIGLGAIATGVGAPIALGCGIGAIVVSKILKPKYNSDTKQTIRDCVKALITSQDESTQDESTIVSYEQYQKQSKEKVTKSYTVLHDLEFRDDKCISKIFIPRNKIHHMWELLSSKKIIASVLKDTFHENPRIEKLLLLIKAQYEFRIEKNNEQQTFFIIKSTDDAQDIFQIEAALFKLFNTYNEVDILQTLSFKVNFQCKFREEFMTMNQEIAAANQALSKQIEAIKKAQNAIRLLEKQEQNGDKEARKKIETEKNLIAIQYHQIKEYCTKNDIDFVILSNDIGIHIKLGCLASRVQALETKIVTLQKTQSTELQKATNELQKLNNEMVELKKQLAELSQEPIKLKNSISDIDLNDNFVGRTEEQQIIQKLLEDDNTKVIAVTGVGGMGKSTLCAEVAGFLATPLTQRQSGRLTSDKLNSISTDLNESEWCAHTFDARSEEDLRKGLASLGRTILSEQALTNISKTYSKPQEIQKQIIIESSSALEKHLKENGKQFLFIFDNVNDIADIEQYLKYAGKNVKILVNSQNDKVYKALNVKPIILSPLLPAECLEYLNNRLGDDHELDKTKLEEIVGIIGSKKYGCAPYFVKLAADYIVENQEPGIIAEYIEEYKAGDENYTVQKLFQSICNKSENAWKILQYCGYLDSFIDKKLMHEIVKTVTNSAELRIKERNEIISELLKSSLLTENNGKYKLDELTQIYITQFVNKTITKPNPKITHLAEEEILINLTKILNDSIKDDDIKAENWGKVGKYTSHAKSVLNAIKDNTNHTKLIYNKEAVAKNKELLTNLIELSHKMTGYSIDMLRDYDQAIKYCEIIKSPQAYHVNGTKDLEALKELGHTYTYIGKALDYKGDGNASTYYKTALTTYQTAYSNNEFNSDIAKAYNNLGSACHNNKQFVLAKNCYTNASKIKMKLCLSNTSADDYLSLAATFNNFADLAHDMFKSATDQRSAQMSFNESRYSFQQALLLLDKYHGSKSNIADTHNNLGRLYLDAKALPLAVEEFKQSLISYKQAYAAYPGHHSISFAHANLGQTYEKYNNFANAIAQFTLAINSINTRNYLDKNDQLEIASNYGDLGHVYHRWGKFDKAIEYYLLQLDMKHEIYGQDAKNTSLADTYQNLGGVCIDNGDAKSATEHYTKNVESLRALPKPHWPTIIDAYKNLGNIYHELKDYNQQIVSLKELASAYKQCDDYENLIACRDQLTKAANEACQATGDMRYIQEILVNYDVILNTCHFLMHDKTSPTFDHSQKAIEISNMKLKFLKIVHRTEPQHPDIVKTIALNNRWKEIAQQNDTHNPGLIQLVLADSADPAADTTDAATHITGNNAQEEQHSPDSAS